MLNKGMLTSNTEEWATPQQFFDELNKEFHFTLDPCSTDENAKCEKHYTKEDDGLSKNWGGKLCSATHLTVVIYPSGWKRQTTKPPRARLL